MANDERTTSVTLLRRIKHNNDADTWRAFVERYCPTIHNWLVHDCRVQDADAADVVQEMLIKLFQKLHEFEYDASKSFRGWLRTVALNTWRDVVRSRSVQGQGGSSVQEILLNIPDDHLNRKLEPIYDIEELEEAKHRVSEKWTGGTNTLAVFRLLMFESKTPQEVADVLHMRVGAVYQAKLRIKGMLLRELEQMRAQD